MDRLSYPRFRGHLDKAQARRAITFLFLSFILNAVSLSPTTGTQDRPILSLREVVQRTHMIVIARVMEINAGSPPLREHLTAKLRVESTVFGDPTIKSITMLESAEAAWFSPNELRLVLVFRIYDKDNVQHELTTKSTGGRSLPIRAGIVGPMEFAGEAKHQKLEEFVQKIEAIWEAKLHPIP